MSLSQTAKLYISTVIVLGSVLVVLAATHLQVANGAMFATFGLLAVLGAALKLRVPRVDGNVSLSFLPLILGTLYLSWQETILVTAAATLVQAVAFSKRFRAMQAAFNVAALVISVGFASMAGAVLVDSQLTLVRVVVAGMFYYVVNSVLVSTVIGLTSGRSVREIWDECLRLYLPYFFAGLACAAIAVSPREGKTSGLIVVSLMLLVREWLKKAKRPL